jgi:hypothetical protein
MRSSPTIRRSRRAATAVLATAVLAAVPAGCGGDDDDDGPQRRDPGVTGQAVKSIRLDTRRPQVERKLGSPSLDRSDIPSGYTKGEPKSLVCVYYARQGNANGFFQLCYDSRDRLRRVLSIG